MPAYYDMIISHSPPLFTISHSPPSSFFTDFRRAYESPKGLYRPQTAPSNKSLLNHMKATNPSIIALKGANSIPKRSCLVVKTDKSAYLNLNPINALNNGSDSIPINNAKLSATIENNDDSDRRRKKSVVFADDKGLELTEVKIMSEPSNVPPFWTLQFLAEVTHGLISPVPPEQWTVDFRQPASDYLEFRKTLDAKNLSLENVIVRENENLVVGTIKVRNLDFNKEVVVRVTYDNWKSQEDIFCVYSNIGGLSYAIYDTFSFKLTLPPASKRVEFCICFRCNGLEYWDNNNGKNYTLSKRMSNVRSVDGILTFPDTKLNFPTNTSTDQEHPWAGAASDPAEAEKIPYW